MSFIAAVKNLLIANRERTLETLTAIYAAVIAQVVASP